MHFIGEYAMFLLEAITIAVMIVIVFALLVSISAKNKIKEKLRVIHLNKKLNKDANKLREQCLSKKAYKHYLKTQKKQPKNQADKQRAFVLDFHGDIRAQAVTELRQAIDMLLLVATKEDEVILRLESPGGVVPGYGLAASEIMRLKHKGIPLTICVDKVAASGGYMMACVADKLLAAPFAIIGSIGVIAQLPNFHRLLKKNDIDFEQVLAGEYKRTLTMLGENTDKAREKFKQDLDVIHASFKAFVVQQRPQLVIDKVATGEYWLALQAKELGLVDALQTSHDYLLSKLPEHNLYHIQFKQKTGLMKKVTQGAQSLVEHFFDVFKHQNRMDV